MSFSMEVGKWVADSKKETQELHAAIILELFSSVVLDTPGLEGRLRGNWIISSENPANGTFDVVDKDGGKTTQNVQDFVSNLKDMANFDVFLTNNLPYAYRIEYDGWSHTKAPEGMVRKNFIRISNNLDAA